MANSSKKKSGLQRGESKAAFLFCTPAVVLALVFIILPFAMSVVYSFTNKQLIPKVGMETAFVGLKNYIEIFTSKVTVLSFKNTFLYALIVVPSVLVIGTVLAVFVNQKIKGVQVFRLIYFSPSPLGCIMYFICHSGRQQWAELWKLQDRWCRADRISSLHSYLIRV